MHTRVQAAHCHSHLSLSPEKPSFHSKGCAFCVFPKSHSSNGDASPSCKPTFFRAASQAPVLVARASTYRPEPAPAPPPPNPRMTPSPGLLTCQIHSPSSPAHSSNHRLAHSAPSHTTLPVPIPVPCLASHPTSFQGISLFRSCSPVPQPHKAPPALDFLTC